MGKKIPKDNFWVNFPFKYMVSIVGQIQISWPDSAAELRENTAHFWTILYGNPLIFLASRMSWLDCDRFDKVSVVKQ